ncbi:MAG: BatA and WFA domain-containing protein [Clostridia bacterium]|nr:BatA and WFA domain-containing protein [Clostridia bacterium]
MGVLIPSYAWALALLAPIIALYLLRPRSERKTMPSTFLWEQTRHALDTERLDKRLLTNWLFYLQLVILVLGALLLMQPYFEGWQVASDETVIVIDNSASMATESGRVSRLENAKTKAADLMASLDGTPMMTVYALHDQLDLLYRGHDKVLAASKVQALEQSYGSSDFKALSDTISGYNTAETPYQVFVFSDHVLGEANDLQYALVDEGSNAMSIESVVHRSTDEEQFRISLKNHQSHLLTGELLVYGDGVLKKMLPLDIAPLSSETLSLSFPKESSMYRFEWQGDDDYTLDNTYYLAIESNANKKVILLGEENRFFEEALMALPNVSVYKSEMTDIDDNYDVYIYNGVQPDALPDTGAILLVNPKSSTSYCSVGKQYSGGQLTFDMSDELWHYVTPNFKVKQVTALEADLGKSVMSIDGMPVMIKGAIDHQRVVLVGMDFAETDFPIRIGFPVFLYNTITYLVGDLQRGEVQGTVGDAMTLYGVPRAQERYLIDEAGHRERLGDAYFLELKMAHMGFYCLEETDGDVTVSRRWLGVNVSREESIDFAAEEGTDLSVLSADVLGRTFLKWPLAVALLLLLFMEWWVYNRGY